MNKSLKKEIKDVKAGKIISFKTIKDSLKNGENWGKKHPVLKVFKRIWWWTKYGVKNEIEFMPLNVRTFLQRGRNGWGKRDTWSYDYYLAKVISQGIQHLKENISGCPANLTKGKWIDILNKIIYTFELAKQISEDNLYLINSIKKRKQWQKSLNEINKEHNSNYRCMTNKEIKAYNEGWTLFKNYFFNLQD